jgi:hypothetical protein
VVSLADLLDHRLQIRCPFGIMGAGVTEPVAQQATATTASRVFRWPGLLVARVRERGIASAQEVADK